MTESKRTEHNEEQKQHQDEDEANTEGNSKWFR